MKHKIFLHLFFIFLGTHFCFALHIKLDKKEMSFLASQQKVNVLFTYDAVLFNADNFNEKEFLDYIKEKIEAKQNAEEALDWETKHLFCQRFNLS